MCKFMFYDNFKETADKLPDDMRLKFYDALTDYAFKGIEASDVVINALITTIKPYIDKVEKKESTKRFSKPSLEEINTYCHERNNGIIAEEFFDFYESKGWKVGSSPMKDWRAAVRTWEKKHKPEVKTDDWSWL